VRAPDVVRAEGLGGARRDVSDLGTFVRSRESQLRHCYQENGLKVNPNLAGTVTVAITLTGAGNVTGARVTNRTWSGPGASQAESCILARIRSWRFPSSEAGGGTFSFPFNFTT
jgi:TonB family protein